MSVLSQLLEYKLVAIIRGVAAKDVASIVEALYNGGIRAIEITLNTENAFELIAQTANSMQGKMLVGAGTVLDEESAATAIASGAQFIISPSVDLGVIKLTKAKGAVSMPGAFTATEIVTAYRAGADIIKVFPASSPKYIEDLRGPLSHIPLMPTGGVGLENIKAFQQAGAVAFGIGSSLVKAGPAVTTNYLTTLTAKASLFVQAIQNQS